MDEASSWNYEDWAELIFSNFFNEENAGEEILFAVDDAVLAEISGLSEEGGATSLARAVKSMISGQWRLASISDTTRVWKRQGG
ncbi:MAG: hypothetical protein QGF28_06735, partial [Candidatus Thalassarchaeaceae archaeon]|nr:hypothetical protein [Candidatus Thalassarchaeaceae archaeon]